MGDYGKRRPVRKSGVHPLLYKTVRVWFEGHDRWDPDHFKVMYVGEMWKLGRLDPTGHPAGEEFWTPVAGFERIEEVLE